VLGTGFERIHIEERLATRTTQRGDEKNIGAVIADSKFGKLQGHSQNDIYVFRGIPFARPPNGSLRFRAAGSRTLARCPRP